MQSAEKLLFTHIFLFLPLYQVGLAVEIKLEAYPYNKYGTVNGTVKYTIPSSFNFEQLGSVYLVKLELDDSDDNIDIMSGLYRSVEIKTGKRTVITSLTLLL